MLAESGSSGAIPDPRRTLGKYQLIAEIGRGGMGVVYLAMVQGRGGFNKLVVVKELLPELAEEPIYLEMFLEEARLAARLNHPNIVQTNEVDSDNGRYFIAMDFLDGCGLNRIRRRAMQTHDFTLPMQLRILSDILAGLDYAHRYVDFDGRPLGIVHRDVSPQNVFITFEGQIKLLDFGIAKAADSSNVTKTGMLKGKVWYMAPEQVRGQRVDARADVYAAGVLLWEMLTGKRLSQVYHEHEVMLAIADSLPRASTHVANIEPELDDLCAHAMRSNPEERLPSAAQFHQALEVYLLQSGQNVSSRDVGRYASMLFAREREYTKAQIESYIAGARGDVDLSLPMMNISYAPQSAVTGSPHPALTSASALSSRSVSASSMRTASGSAPTRWLAPAAGAVVALVVIAVLGVGLMSKPAHTESPPPTETPLAEQRPPEPRPVTPPPVAAPPPMRDVEPAVKLIGLSVRVSPSRATLTIDGAEVPGNPFYGRYVNDGAMHQIHASASGYQSKTLAIPFGEKDVYLNIPLEKVRVARTPSSKPSMSLPARTLKETTLMPEESPRSTLEINAGGGSRPNRPIDPNNPYGEH